MKRFNDNDEKNGMKRFVQNYGQHQHHHQHQQQQQQQQHQHQQHQQQQHQQQQHQHQQLQQHQQPQQQQQQQQSGSQDIYGVSLSQYYNGAQLNKEQFKYTSPSVYSTVEQTTPYYNSYFNNQNWRFSNANKPPPPPITASPTFTYDPSQPPPPLPKLNNKTDSSQAPPPPLPPGEPPYFPSPPLSMKSPLPINPTPPLPPHPPPHPPPPQGIENQQPFPPIDPTCAPPNITTNGMPRRGGILTRGVFRGGGGGIQQQRGERLINNIKRNNAYNTPFKKTKLTPFKPPIQMNGQKKHPLSINKLQNNKNSNEGDDDGDDNLSHIQVNKKAKRKPMSTRYPRKIEWDRGDALKALALEKEYNKLQRNSMLILKFPDPELNKNIVKEYSPYIESVHFQQPSTPRYCFVQLKEGVDIEKVREDLCQIPFGVGKIVAERKRMHTEEDDTVNPEDIDPYTLYIGNLPTTITVKTVKEHFPNSRRIDIGYAQRMRYTRYAFIRYETVEDAMDAYRNTFNLLIESRSLIVRFRRQKGNVGLPGESKQSNPKKETTNQSKKQNNPLTANKDDSTSANHEFEDDDVRYVCGEPSKSNDVDTKANVLEEARKLAEQTVANSDNDIQVIDNIEIKQEPIEGRPSRRNNSWVVRVKDEPVDDDELLRQADIYEEIDYSDDDPEEVDDYASLIYPNDDDVTISSQENQEDGDGYEYFEKDEKPDVKGLPVPFPIFNENESNDSSHIFVSKTAEAVYRGNLEKTKEQKKREKPKKAYRDELDELFDRMNSDDDDFSF